MTSDHLGSMRVVTSAADVGGNVTVKARYDYLPFGEEIGSDKGNRTSVTGYGASDGTRQKFTQKERDNESGLDYFGARYYSSAQGRFTSADPLDPVLGKQGANHSPEARSEFDLYLSNPQHWNRYPIVLNNPLSLVDPDGLDEGTIEVRVNVIWDEKSRYSPKEKKAILERYVNQANKMLAKIGISLVVNSENSGTVSDINNPGSASVSNTVAGALNVFMTKDNGLASTEVTVARKDTVFLQTSQTSGLTGKEQSSPANDLAHGALHAFGLGQGQNGYWNNPLGLMKAEADVVSLATALDGKWQNIRTATNNLGLPGSPRDVLSLHSRAGNINIVQKGALKFGCAVTTKIIPGGRSISP